MDLTKNEKHYLRQRKPFERLMWHIDKDGAACCFVRIPSQLLFDKFSILFDMMELSSSSKDVILYYGAISSYHNFLKRNLFHMFDLTEKDVIQLLKQIVESRCITILAFSEKELTFLGSKKVDIQPKIVNTLEAILNNNKVATSSQQTTTTQQPRAFPFKTEEQRVFTSLQPDELLRFPLIERCRYRLQKEVQQLSNQNSQITRQIFWRLLLIAGLDQARSFTFSDDATKMIEQKRLLLKHSNWPVLTPDFSLPHLWFGFSQPMKTLVCNDIAAIFLFRADDSSLREHTPTLRSVSDQEWKVLHDEVYKPGYHLLSLNVVNTQGAIVWSMSLPTTIEEAQKHLEQPWLVPAWFQCPYRSCQRLRGRDLRGEVTYSYHLCEKCKYSQLFFSTWLMTAWQALMGAYREKPLDTIGSRRVDHFYYMASPYLRDLEPQMKHMIEHRYQIITYKDISKGLDSDWHPVLHPTGSWVTALMAFDQNAVTWQKRTVLPHYRVLRAPRYKEPGKMVPVRSHIRSTPMSTDRLNKPRETRVKAENHNNEGTKN